MKLAHTMLRIDDIEASLDFYQNILGLKLSRTMELKDATLYFLTDEKENYAIELTYNHKKEDRNYTHGRYFGHLALYTKSMDEFSKKLQKNNLTFDREPFFIRKDKRIAFVKDPNGISVEIIEESP